MTGTLEQISNDVARAQALGVNELAFILIPDDGTLAPYLTMLERLRRLVM